VNPSGCATTYVFQYGTSTTYGSTTPTHTAGSGTAIVAASAVIGGLTPNSVYHFRLLATSAAGQAAGADESFATPSSCPAASAPQVVSDAGTMAHKTTVSFKGTVNSGGCAATYTFEYGTTTAYGASTTTRSVKSNTARAVTAVVSGLSPTTLYHYRLVATDADGTAVGIDTTVSTGFACVANVTAAPTVRTDRATVRGIHRAVLRATITNHGCQTVYYFDYGKTKRYGHSTITRTLAGSGGSQTIALPVSGLAEHTRYHFRAIATSPSGTTFGRDATLTSAAGPSTLSIGRGPVQVIQGAARMMLRCSAGSTRCRGSVLINSQGKRLGNAKFSIRAGHKATVTVALSRVGRAFVSHFSMVRIKVVANVRGHVIHRELTLVVSPRHAVATRGAT
jgi:hypothetical protein